MAASKYHFNREYSKVLKSYISIETLSIQILFFKNLYHLNSESNENFLNVEVYRGFLLDLILRVFKEQRRSFRLVFLIFRECQPRIVLSLFLTVC